MPEDPKKVFKKLRADQDERGRVKVQRELDRQRYRSQRGAPPEQENESEAAKWVRANFEWESHPGLWCPKYTTYSDYTGSCLDKSNSMALLRDYPELFEQGTGGYGSIWTGIPEDKRTLIDEETFSSLKDVIDGMEDYPVIDEDLMSNLEMDGKWEHWEEYGRDGIREALVEKFGGYEGGERDPEAPVDVNAQIAVFLQSNEFWDTMFHEREWDQHMEEEPGLSWAFHEKRAVRNVGADEIVNEEAINAFKRAHFIKNDLAEFVTMLAERGLEVSEDQALNIFLRLEPRFDVWDVQKRVYGHGRNADGTCPEVDPDDYISIGSSALTDMADAVAPGDIDAAERTRWANDPRQTKLPGFESQARALVASLLEADDPKRVFKVLPRSNWEIKWVDSTTQPRICRFHGYTRQEAEAKLRRDDEVAKIVSIEPLRPESAFEAEDPKKFLKDRCSLTVDKIHSAREAIFKHYGTSDYEAISLAAALLRTGSRHEETVDRMGCARCAVCGWVDGRTNEVPDPIFHPDYWRPIGGGTVEEAEDPKSVFKKITRIHGQGVLHCNGKAYPIVVRSVSQVDGSGEIKHFGIQAPSGTWSWWTFDKLRHPRWGFGNDEIPVELNQEVRKWVHDNGLLSEAESPKGVWGAIKARNKDTTHVHVVGRRWFSRNFGNTYFAADIYVNDKLVHQIPYEYGHGDHYEDRSWEWLEDHGYIPKRKRSANGGMTAPWRWAEQNGIRLTKEVYDVARRRDL